MHDEVLHSASSSALSLGRTVVRFILYILASFEAHRAPKTTSIRMMVRNDIVVNFQPCYNRGGGTFGGPNFSE